MNCLPTTSSNASGSADSGLHVTDAYMHIGVPRFGSPDHLLRALDTYRISQAVVVLGPLVPDLPSLFEAMRRYPGRVRGIGIPFGADAAQRLELARMEVKAGVLGMRLSYEEGLETPGMLELLGDNGRCIYALNPVGSARSAESYLEWLSRYPDSFIAAPHFLKHGFGWEQRQQLDSSCIALMRHPRFYAILSRQGGNGTNQPYPHADYVTWVEFVLLHCGWERILWGSEFPVFLWRNETYAQCLSWLARLLPETSPAQLQAFHAGNAKRLLFNKQTVPPGTHAAIPEWLEEQFSMVRNRTVPLIQNTALELPGDLYFMLLDGYMQSEMEGQERTFNDYLTSVLYDILNKR
ncbi:amidohydrolase family protein [Paenibacillus sp. TAB 01]|uniref:amidohydrolase family protein n=1 Tax=Paenibacillus sp. TAB 01 TaxID=3368988 RepID=UPI003750DB65